MPFKTRMSRVEANKKEGTDSFKEKNYTYAARYYASVVRSCHL